MAVNRRISNEVMRLLYAHSGNRCAFPGCHAPIFEEDGLLTAECCHIKAFSPGGPRYDATQTDAERNGVENLILLCSRHHRIVDADVQTYTVEMLQKYKLEHELQYNAEMLKLTDEQLRYLLMSSESFWKRIEEIDYADVPGADFKMRVENQKSIEELIEALEDCINNIDDILSGIISADNELLENIRDIISDSKMDLDEFNRLLVSRGSSDLILHNWEYNNLAAPNTMNQVKMLYLQLVVKLLEYISYLTSTEHPMLNMYREKLANHQEHNYYYD